MEEEQQELAVNNMFLEMNTSYNWYVSTGIKKLDDFLKGGFLRGAVSQIFGEAGTGKSQLTMQFILGASLHKNRAFVISTDKMFHLQRFQQLKQHFQNSNKVSIQKRWQIHQCSSTLKFDDIFTIFENSRGWDILIIDNIFRVITDKMTQQEQIGKSDIYHKARIQRIFVNTLREIAKKRKLAVVLINNASANFNQNKYARNEVKAALSTSWDNQMDQNIQVSKFQNSRKLKIVFSIKAPNQEIPFVIENNKGFVI